MLWVRSHNVNLFHNVFCGVLHGGRQPYQDRMSSVEEPLEAQEEMPERYKKVLYYRLVQQVVWAPLKGTMSAL